MNGNGIRSGIRTTEWGMTALVAVMDMLQTYRADHNNTLTALVTHVITGLVVATYIWARTRTKQAHVQGDPKAFASLVSSVVQAAVDAKLGYGAVITQPPATTASTANAPAPQ